MLGCLDRHFPTAAEAFASFSMAAVPATQDDPTIEEQVIAAEASSTTMELDLKQMREDRREFIKVACYPPLASTLVRTCNAGGFFLL